MNFTKTLYTLYNQTGDLPFGKGTIHSFVLAFFSPVFRNDQSVLNELKATDSVLAEAKKAMYLDKNHLNFSRLSGEEAVQLYSLFYSLGIDCFYDWFYQSPHLLDHTGNTVASKHPCRTPEFINYIAKLPQKAAKYILCKLSQDGVKINEPISDFVNLDYLKLLSEESLVELRSKNCQDINDAKGLFLYAYMTLHGYGGPKDEGVARRNFDVNLHTNLHPRSKYELAMMRLHGTGGPQDEVKARDMFKTNWEQNKHLPSLNAYANLLFKGIGGEKNIEEATKLYIHLDELSLTTEEPDF